MLAEEIRGYMASMGFRTFQEMIGRCDMLKPVEKPTNSKSKMLRFDRILKKATDLRDDVSIVGGCMAQDFELDIRMVSGSGTQTWCLALSTMIFFFFYFNCVRVDVFIFMYF